jgi:hypothetical protein
MSAVTLPIGTSVVAMLFRPMIGCTGTSVVNLFAATALHAKGMVAAIRADRDRLLGVVPRFLHPGAPVCLVISITLPDGDTHAFTIVAETPRATYRDDVGERLIAMLLETVDARFAEIDAAIASKVAA